MENFSIPYIVYTLKNMIGAYHIKNVILGLSIFLSLCAKTSYSQTSFTSKNAKISIYSSTPLEDIEAESNKGVSVIIPKYQQIIFQLALKSLVFPRPLMQEHFNENYMESDKYPNAIFKGKIMEDVDFKQDGTYPVTVKGLLTLHNVTKERTIKGIISINNGKLTVSSSFDVLCADHQIKIPRIVFKKIAEKITITVKSNYN